MARIGFTHAALGEFREILDYLRERAPAAAGRVGTSLLARIDRLAQFPELGALVHEHETGQFRRLVAGHYVIWYRLRRGGEILVLGIRHGRQRPLDLQELEQRAVDQ